MRGGFSVALIILVAFACVLSTPAPCRAATYYVDAALGNDSSGDGSSAHPWRTVKHGLGELVPGDTLTLKDGVYTGEENNISGPYGGWDDMPSGTAAAPITIRGASYLGAIIDGGDQYNPIFVWNVSYLVFENLHLRNTGVENGGANFRAQDCHHILVRDCVSEEAYFGHFWLRNSSYCLVEDCAAWGRSAYSFVAVGEYEDYTRSQYNVFRRCLARRDVHFYPDHEANHFASFVAYWADNTYFLNCVSIDGTHVDDEGNVPDDDWIATASFFTTNGASNFAAIGCIVLDDVGQLASCSPGDQQAILFRGNAALMADDSSFGILAFAANASFRALNNTISNVRGTGDWQGQGIGEVEGSVAAVRNNLIFGNRIGLDRVSGQHSYNVLYDNDQDYNETTPGSGERTDVDPFANGLEHLPRVEEGSVLAGLGEGGAQVGAQIVYRIGADDSFYGDAGWNTLSDVSLWPWPHEGELKVLMGAYNLHGVDGARGFCAAGTALYGGSISLSSTVWEALGNPAPTEMVGGGGACTPPAITTQPASTTVASGGQATLQVAATGTAPLSYQWYRGSAGDTGSPVAGATAASYTTAALTVTTRYWVRVSNDCGSADSSTATVTVSSGGGQWRYLVPAAAHNPGAANTMWRTDVAVLNRSAATAQLEVSCLPASGSAPAPHSASVPAGTTVRYANILESLLGVAASASLNGSLVIDSDQPLLVSSRTYNQTDDGTYGQYLPALVVDDAIGAGDVGYLLLLEGSDDFRSNVGVVNLGTASATAQIQLYNAVGTAIGSAVSVSVPPAEWRQVNDVFAAAGAGQRALAFATVRLSSASGEIWAYASLIDAATGDPTTVPVQLQPEW